MRPNKPYDVAARALFTLRDNEPNRNPRFVQDHGMESDEEANFKATPPPQVLMAVCGSTMMLEEANLKTKPPPSAGGVV